MGDPEMPQSDLDKPDQWRRISVPLWRGLKRSIEAAEQCGAINRSTADRMIKRFHLRDL